MSGGCAATVVARFSLGGSHCCSQVCVVGVGCVCRDGLQLVASWLYKDYGTTSNVVNSSFRALKPVVVAIVCNSVKRLAEHAFRSPAPGGHTNYSFDVRMLLLGIMCALWWVLKVSPTPRLPTAGQNPTR